MSSPSYTHIHTYVGVSGMRKQYRCMKLGCPHVISASLLAGREAECPNCKRRFFVTREHLRRRKVACIGGCGLPPAPEDKKPVVVAATLEPKASEKPLTARENKLVASMLRTERKKGSLPPLAREKWTAWVRSLRTDPNQFTDL